MSAPAVTHDSSLRLIRALGLIALIAGVLIVWVYELTLPRIEDNKQRAIEAAVFTVIKDAVQRRDFIISDQQLRAATGNEGKETWKVYAGYDADGKLKGVALEGSAQGYSGVIRLLYGYDPQCQCINGMVVIQATETPGLGDAIGKNPQFLANFTQLDAQLNGGGDALAHDIVTVRHGRKKNAWEIDAISGATVSSKAVGRAINGSAQQQLPIIQQQLPQLMEANHGTN